MSLWRRRYEAGRPGKHELARELGNEKTVLCICHMDKAYMQGFHHIRYERTTAVSEGAECCDYHLRFDPEKK